MELFVTALLIWGLLLDCFHLTAASPSRNGNESFNRTVSRSVFLELEELSRLVAISYCVGETGIHKPFECLSHCSDFKGFELIKVALSLYHHIYRLF